MEETEQLSEAMERLEKNIDKEVAKLKYYMESADELIENNDYIEMEIAVKQGTQIIDKITDLISQLEGMKLDFGVSGRDVRQWRKDKKNGFSPFMQEKDKISEILATKRRERDDEVERQNWEAKREREERVTRERQQQEKKFWEEKFEAELRVAEKKLEMETAAKANHAKLPKITPFKGTSSDWVRFENMFITQVHNRRVSDEEKFGYLLEMVVPKVRERISNLKPSALGYKTAWERLQKEYGQTKLVVNAHMDEIIYVTPVKGNSYDKIRDFYERLSKNFDALQTLEEEYMLRGFVMTTLKKLPQVKPDLVRVDDNWEEWNMKELIENLRKWLQRNKTDDSSADSGDSRRRERHWYTKGKRENGREPRGPSCLYCQGDHWGEACEVFNTVEKRRKFFHEKKLCFNCGREGHGANYCRSRPCFKCKSKHHTSLCDRPSLNGPIDGTVFTAYNPGSEDRSLPAIIPLKIQGVVLWAYLDTGSGRNFISREAIKKLNLKPKRHESHQFVTINGVQKQSMPIFEVRLDSLDNRRSEQVEITGSKMEDFTTVRRPTIKELKTKYEHARDKQFYMTANEEYPIHVILGDSTYCKIRTEQTFKGRPKDPIVEGTTFGWIIHGGEDYADDKCMFVKEAGEYEKLYSLDVLGVEDRGEDDQSDVYSSFKGRRRPVRSERALDSR